MKVRGPRQNLTKQKETTGNSSAMVSNSAVLNLLQDEFTERKGIAPIYRSVPKQRVTRRFRFGTNFSGNFTLADGHAQFLVATGTTTAATYVDCWRMRKATFYLRNNEQDYSCQIQVTPSGSDTANNNVVGIPMTRALESQSSSEARILIWKPSRLSPAGMWHYTNTVSPTGIMFALACSSGGGSIDANSMMEIDFEYVTNTFGTLKAYTLTGLSALTVGSLYGASVCAGLLPVLDVNSAF